MYYQRILIPAYLKKLRSKLGFTKSRRVRNGLPRSNSAGLTPVVKLGVFLLAMRDFAIFSFTGF